MEEKFEESAVIDASFLLCYLLPDENIDKIQRVFDRYKKGELLLISTHLLYFEVLNGLNAAILSKRLDFSLAKELIYEFLKLTIRVEKVDYIDVFDTVVKNNISIYDAAYLQLAVIKKITLLTLDKRLIKLLSKKPPLIHST